MIRQFLKILGVLALTGTLIACGDAEPDGRASHNTSVSVQGFALNGHQNSDFLEAGSLTQKVQEVSQLQLEIAGCRSGYHVVTSSVQKLQLYKHDRDCSVILHGFQFNGEIYRPSGQPLKGPVGTSALFRSQKNEIAVVISSTISSPVQDHDAIAYSIGNRLQQGSTKKVLGVNAGISGRIRRGNRTLHTPFFKVVRSSMIAVIPETKSFGIRFDLECIDDIKHEARPELRRCRRAKLKDLSYLLVEDRYQNHPTFEQMEHLFKNGGINVDPQKDYKPADHGYHGGFATSSGPIILRTPNNTAIHSKMILILKSSRSYQYFNLDMQTGF